MTARAESVTLARAVTVTAALWLIAIGIAQAVTVTTLTPWPTLFVAAGGILLVAIRRGVDR